MLAINSDIYVGSEILKPGCEVWIKRIKSLLRTKGIIVEESDIEGRKGKAY